MKKYFKIIFLLIIIFSCSGCVKYEENMKIGNNKKMTLSLIVATDNAELKSQIFNKKEISNLSKYYSVSKYNDKKFSGYKLIWNTSNIDKISSSSNHITYSLTNIRESVPTKIFTLSDGFFSSTYYADFIFDPSTVELLDTDDSKSDLKFSVNLDTKALSNNADKVNNDGKELIWNINSKDITEINFSFKLINYYKIIFTGIFIIILFILMVYSTRKILEKRV